jgi:hypothetical protein
MKSSVACPGLTRFTGSSQYPVGASGLGFWIRIGVRGECLNRLAVAAEFSRLGGYWNHREAEAQDRTIRMLASPRNHFLTIVPRA